MTKPVLKKQPKIKPRIITEVSDLPKPTVFYDHHRKMYLLVSENHISNKYLTMGDEQIEVVKLKHAAPVRNEKGFLPDETTSVVDLAEYKYDLQKAANRFLGALLPKSSEAVRELYKILGKPVPEITEEEKAKREAKVERMKKAREALVLVRAEKAVGEERVLFTPTGWPRGGTIVTISTTNEVTLANDKQKKVWEALIKAGGIQTVGQLRRATGNNSADAVIKTFAQQNIVALS